MKQMKVWMLVLAAVGTAACSNDDNDIDSSIENAHEQPLPLTITITENPLLSPDASAKVRTTRAAITTTQTLTTFMLDYQYERGGELQTGNNNATKDGSGNWLAGAWPSDANDETTVHWFAHTDGAFQSQSSPYLNFTVEELSSNQKDLLVATVSGTRSDTGGNLYFTFDHACTALKFYVKKSTNLNDFTLTVTSIKICNIVKKGKFSFGTSTWTLDDTRSDYTLYSGSAKTLGSTDWTLLNASGDDYLFMIPQVLTAWDATTDIASATTQTYIQIECSLTGGSTTYNGTAYIPFGTTLEKGYQYDVKINIGKNSLYSSSNTKIIH